ncbi:MAG: DMT family transporter [Spirochaetaceae bacterium]|nr:DMT family transporter [Spirochaetaceae bacterium]MDT8296819.1 DMT family transporter [Spirochaetaceae bacterium]
MLENSLGEIIALGAVAGWTISALAFESAGRRIGSVPVNLIRLLMAALMLAVIGIVRGFTPWPAGILLSDTLWLLASGFVGFFLGDLLLFRSYLIIGARLAMLVMSLSPPISALLDRLVFGTRLAMWDGAGMLLTMAGVGLAVTAKRPRPGAMAAAEVEAAGNDPSMREAIEPASVGGDVGGNPKAARSTAARGHNTARWLGFLLAFGGAAGQSGGMILGKLGMAGHDVLAATFVRTLGGMAGFIPMILLTGAAGRVLRGFRDGGAMTRMSIGALAGPVLGVSAILAAMHYSPAGVVSAITAIVPIVIILPSVVFLKDKANAREILGALLAVLGVLVLIVT